MAWYPTTPTTRQGAILDYYIISGMPLPQGKPTTDNMVDMSPHMPVHGSFTLTIANSIIHCMQRRESPMCHDTRSPTTSKKRKSNRISQNIVALGPWVYEAVSDAPPEQQHQSIPRAISSIPLDIIGGYFWWAGSWCPQPDDNDGDDQHEGHWQVPPDPIRFLHLPASCNATMV